jgi:hypothetical protein
VVDVTHGAMLHQALQLLMFDENFENSLRASHSNLSNFTLLVICRYSTSEKQMLRPWCPTSSSCRQSGQHNSRIHKQQAQLHVAGAAAAAANRLVMACQ